MNIEYKYCYRCDKTLSSSEFYRDRNKKDGRESNCKLCKGNTDILKSAIEYLENSNKPTPL